MSLYSLLLAAVFMLASCNSEAQKHKRVAEGNEYYARGDYQKAAAMYRKALDIDQRFGEAYYRLALAQIKLRQLPGAERSLHVFFDLVWREGHIVSPGAWPQVADAAVKVCDIYLALHPDNRDYMNGIGYWASVLLKADPNSYDGHRLQAAALRFHALSGEEEALDPAIAEYKKAHALKPEDDSVVLGYADLLQRSRRYEDAEQLYWSLASAHRSVTPAYTSLYRMAREEKRPEKAAAVVKAAIRQEPQNFQLAKSLTAECLEHRDRGSLMEMLLHIQEHAREFNAPYLYLGQTFEMIGELEAAERQYRSGIRSGSGSATQYQERLIELLLNENKLSEATSLLDDLRRAGVSSPRLRLLEASVLLENGSVSEAIKKLEELRAENPSDPAVLYRLGKAFSRQSNSTLAEQCYNLAIKVDQRYLPAFLGLAELYLKNGNSYLAQTAARNALTLQPLNPKVSSFVAALESKLSDADRTRTAGK